MVATLENGNYIDIMHGLHYIPEGWPCRVCVTKSGACIIIWGILLQCVIICSTISQHDTHIRTHIHDTYIHENTYIYVYV